MRRVLTVAIDGATMDLIKPWADAGKLPALAKLIREGVSGRLESTLPPVTSPAWPSFATGKNPGKHGVFDFIANTQGEFGLVNASSIDGRTLWDLLSSYGARVGIMGVPVTYPPSPVNGYMITGLLSPKGAEISYPQGFLSRYEEELGRYRVAPSIGYKRGKEEPFLADLRDMVRQRGRFALKLMEGEPWDRHRGEGIGDLRWTDRRGWVAHTAPAGLSLRACLKPGTAGPPRPNTWFPRHPLRQN